MIRKLLLSCALSSSLLFQAHALEQPATIPEGYLMTEQKLPPLADIVNRARPDYPVYGIYTWFGEYKQLREQIKQVGWSTLRIGGPTSDENMAMLFEDGHNFCCMASGKGKRDKFDSDETYIKASLEGLNEFFDRFGAGGSFYKSHPQFADRYIPFMTLRNEPNFHYMYKAGSEAQREALYAKLAPQLIELIKKRSPKTKIIGFTAGGAGAGDLRFIKHVLEIDKRALTETDVFSTHPYVDPAAPETNKIEKWGSYSIANSLFVLRRTFDQYGKKDIPVWYTEGGFKISKADGAAYNIPAKQTVPIKLQAAYNCRYYAWALRLGVDCVTTMFITDTDGYPGGFFDRLNDMKWRPNAFALQNMIRIMPHPVLRGAQADGEDGIYIFEFGKHAQKKNSPSVLMAYRVEGPKTVDITVTSTKTKITDMLGGETIVDTPNRSLKQEIGPYPIYIEEAK